MRTLADVYEDYRTDKAFDHLRRPDRPLVPGEGSSKPKLFIVGEAPGATENTQRRPFVGASGLALRSLLIDSAGIPEEDCFITNTVKYWPGPGNRTPSWEEVENSRRYLRQEYAALGSPPVLVAVGAVPLSALAPDSISQSGILRSAGQPISLPHGKVLWPMVHPAYGLRNKSFRPTMETHWEDLGDWYRTEIA